MEGGHSEDNGALCHLVSHSPRWHLAPLGPPQLPGTPPRWTLASALPGEHSANGPQGLSQVLPGGEMRKAKGAEAGGGSWATAHRDQGRWWTFGVGFHRPPWGSSSSSQDLALDALQKFKRGPIGRDAGKVAGRERNPERHGTEPWSVWDMGSVWNSQVQSWEALGKSRE